MNLFNSKKSYLEAFKKLLPSKVGFPIIILLTGYSIFFVAGLVNESVRETAMKRFHTSLSFWNWAILQPAPSMYAFDNVVTATTNDGRTHKRQVNHHVYRVLSDSPSWKLYDVKDLVELKIVSKYRGSQVETHFTLEHTENGIHVRR